MHADARPYYHFTRKSRLDKSINTLLGLLEGIAIDGKVTPAEVGALKLWLVDHQDVARKHPFNELVPAVMSAVDDGVLDPEEREDLLWLCKQLQSQEFYDQVTTDLQRLHAIVGGIASDGVISVEEIKALSAWLSEHEHLKTCYPYDEIDTLTTQVLRDQRIDAEEHKLLLAFFSEFLAMLDERTLVAPIVVSDDKLTISALCAMAPAVQFAEARFCFTGASSKHKRSDLEAVVRRLGGQVVPGVTAKLNYLVIGAEGNPCWAYACYGRKVEKAVELRRQGVRVVLMHEYDFHDAVQDAG